MEIFLYVVGVLIVFLLYRILAILGEILIFVSRIANR